MRQMSARPSRSRSPTEIEEAAAPRVGRCHNTSPLPSRQKSCPSLEAAATRPPPSDAAKITGAAVDHDCDEPPMARSHSILLAVEGGDNPLPRGYQYFRLAIAVQV